jgi:hypothetical protein
MTGDERRNVVPVDWVSRVMCRLINNPAAHGLTFHLSPRECVTPKLGIEAGVTYFNSTGVQWVGYQSLDPSTYNEMEAELLPALTMYTSYERTDPTFDYQNVERFAADLPCPEIDEQMLHTYIRYGEEDRWGKRREPRPHVSRYVSRDFAQLLQLNETSELPQVSVSLDIRGAGGGQWTLHWLPSGEVAVEPGLVAESTIAMTTEEFSQLMESDSELNQSQLALRLTDQFFPAHFSQLKRARA